MGQLSEYEDDECKAVEVEAPAADERGILAEPCPLCFSTPGFVHKMSCTFSGLKALRFSVTQNLAGGDEQ